MLIDMQGIHDFLVYLTRLAEFKSKENYIPYLTFYKIKYDKSIQNSLVTYFKENLESELTEVTFKQITTELMSYVNYLSEPKVVIGEYSGSDVLASIKEEFNEYSTGLSELEWKEIQSDFMISFSVSGKVYVAQLDEDLLIFDFGFSD